MAFCDQCGSEVGVGVDERYCSACGAYQEVDTPIAVARVSPSTSAWAHMSTQVASLWDDRRVRVAVVYVAALLALALTASFSGSDGAVLLLPLTIGVVISVTKPRSALRWLDRSAAWTAAAHSRAGSKNTRIARWITRPYLGGLTRINTWTARLSDEATRCGVRVAGYLYFSGLFAFAIVVVAYVALAIVIMIIVLIVAFWLLDAHSPFDSTVSRGASRSANRVFGTSVVRKGILWDTPTGTGVNERGQVIKEGVLFDTPTGMKVKADGQFVREGILFDAPLGYKLNDHGQLVKEGVLWDNPTGMRLDEEGDVVREGLLFDEETGIRLKKK
jgi:hypothetical protein